MFGFDEYRCGGEGIVLEIPLRQLSSILRASENQDRLNFEAVEGKDGRSCKLVISTEADFFSSASTVHELTLTRVDLLSAESYFREPLIARPKISFMVPSLALLSAKLGRLERYSSSITIAASHEGRLSWTVSSPQFNGQIEMESVQIVDKEPVVDRPEVLSIQIALESLGKVLACATVLQGHLLAAIVPNETIIFSSKIPNPCGHDRPSGSISIILAAYDNH